MRNLIPALESIVYLTSSELGIPLYYDYGSFKELQKNLIEKSKEQVQKYPLIFLQLDIEEDVDGSAKNINDSSQTIIIINETNREWSSKDRFANSYEAILYPIYEAFINQIKKSVYFLDSLDEYSNLAHTRIDRFYYSSTDAKDQNVLSAYLDAIEIRNLELSLSQNECLPDFPEPVEGEYLSTEDSEILTTENNYILTIE